MLCLIIISYQQSIKVFISLKAPTHYAPYGARCRVDRNISIKTQNLAFCEVTKLIFDIAQQNVCL